MNKKLLENLILVELGWIELKCTIEKKKMHFVDEDVKKKKKKFNVKSWYKKINQIKSDKEEP